VPVPAGASGIGVMVRELYGSPGPELSTRGSAGRSGPGSWPPSPAGSSASRARSRSLAKETADRHHRSVHW